MKEIIINIENKGSIPNNSKMMCEITFSKEMRRLQDKTQMFKTRISEHFRTRLTHTLEVSSISSRIAKNILNLKINDLNIDENLVRAIAYAHDIGHTPYGHMGEDTIFELIKDNDLYFKHNINSAKVLLDPREIKADNKSKTYYNIFSHSFDWRLFDGIIKHTKSFPKKAKKDVVIVDPYNLDPYFKLHPVLSNSDFQNTVIKFIESDKFNGITKSKHTIKTQNSFIYKYLNYPSPLSIEGQIVAIADEISQRVSDFDDSIRLYYKNIENIELGNKYRDMIVQVRDDLLTYQKCLLKIINESYSKEKNNPNPEIKNIEFHEKFDLNGKKFNLTNEDIPANDYFGTRKILKATENYIKVIIPLLNEMICDKGDRNVIQFKIMKKNSDFFINNLEEYLKIIKNFYLIIPEKFKLIFKTTKKEKLINNEIEYSIYPPWTVKEGCKYKPIVSFPNIIENLIMILNNFNYKIINDNMIDDSNKEGKENIRLLYNIYSEDIRLVDNNCKRQIASRYKEWYPNINLTKKEVIDKLAYVLKSKNSFVAITINESQKAKIKQIILESIARMTNFYVEKLIEQHKGHQYFDYNINYNLY